MNATLRLALVSVVGCSSIASAQVRPDNSQQSSKHLPTDAKLSGKIEPSGLRARHGNLDGGYAATVSAADRAYAKARLDEIERIVLKAAPEFGHIKTPMFAQVAGLSGIAKPNTILNYRYSLFADLGSAGFCEVFYAYINETPRGEPDGAEFEHWLGKTAPGASITWNELIPPPNPSWEESFLVRDGDTPYRQLTREEVRRWQIAEEEGANGEKLAERKQFLANTPYQRFMAEAPQRKKTREDLRVVLKGFLTPAQIDAQIKELEDAERKMVADLKAQDANDRAEHDSLSRAQSSADRARASIARMSAAERKLPAYVKQQGGSVDTLFDFGTAEMEKVGRVVRPNLGFWTMHRSRVEVRTMHVAFTAGCPKEPPAPDVHAALWKLRQNIDWAALKRMVNTP